MAINLRPSKAPNIPIAPVDYDQRYVDQLTNSLRLYFSEIDNFTGFLAQPMSGNTADRPAVQLYIGQTYYDTTLGIPIWWNGTVWKNASGTTV
jgi:hypothetical protein